MSTPFYEGTVEYTVQRQSVTASAIQNRLESKKDFHLSRGGVGLCVLIEHMNYEEKLALLRQSRAAGIQGVGHGINGLTACLIYKAADKAMGGEKTKQ